MKNCVNCGYELENTAKSCSKCRKTQPNEIIEDSKIETQRKKKYTSIILIIVIISVVSLSALALYELFSKPNYDFSEYDSMLEQESEVQKEFEEWKTEKEAVDKYINGYTLD